MFEMSASAVQTERAVRAVVILAGVRGRLATVRDALLRNLFDLPGCNGLSLLADWSDRFRESFDDLADVPIYLAVDQGSPTPMIDCDSLTSGFRVIRDADSSRGPAGILRDLARGLKPDDFVLVVQASDLNWPWSLTEVNDIRDETADVVLSADRDLRPAGFMRFQCRMLGRVPSVGFVDLKEQFLARNAATAEVRVLRSHVRKLGSLHSLRSYLAMLGLGATLTADAHGFANATAWRADRAIVEPKSDVDPSAMLFDSVILAGARIGRNAVVVRSLVGPGVEIKSGDEIVDRVVVAAGGKGRGHRDVVW